MISKEDWDMVRKVLKELTGDDAKYKKIFTTYGKAAREGNLEAIAKWEAMIRPIVEQYRSMRESKARLVMEVIMNKAIISSKNGCFDDRRWAQLLAEAKAAMEDGVLGSIDHLRIDPFSL